MKNTKQKSSYLWLVLPITVLAVYILRIASDFINSKGITNIAYTSSYPLILLAEYLFISLLFIPFTVKARQTELHCFIILPLMLFSSLGMMRIDSAEALISNNANYYPAIMFIILLITLMICAFSEITPAGIAGTAVGTLLCPAFGLCFSPFIAAASFLLPDKSPAVKKASVVLNCTASAVCTAITVIKCGTAEFSFSKKYIPVIILTAALCVFFTVKKDYELIPLGLLPVFPLVGGIFFGAFPTPLFTLSACVAPLVILLGCAVMNGENVKLKGYAEKILHNPALIIIITVFILHTVCAFFVSPGSFRDVYVKV